MDAFSNGTVRVIPPRSVIIQPYINLQPLPGKVVAGRRRTAGRPLRPPWEIEY